MNDFPWPFHTFMNEHEGYFHTFMNEDLGRSSTFMNIGEALLASARHHFPNNDVAVLSVMVVFKGFEK